jgi:hypothetical protein
LYDGIKKSWQTVVVDDWIPCSAATGKPMFAKTNEDNAAWVLLLEKAMAKFKVGLPSCLKQHCAGDI